MISKIMRTIAPGSLGFVDVKSFEQVYRQQTRRDKWKALRHRGKFSGTRNSTRRRG